MQVFWQPPKTLTAADVGADPVDPEASEGELGIYDANGELTSAGFGSEDIQVKVSGATEGNLACFDADGFLIDSGIAVDDLVGLLSV